MNWLLGIYASVMLVVMCIGAACMIGIYFQRRDKRKEANRRVHEALQASMRRQAELDALPPLPVFGDIAHLKRPGNSDYLSRLSTDYSKRPAISPAARPITAAAITPSSPVLSDNTSNDLLAAAAMVALVSSFQPSKSPTPSPAPEPYRSGDGGDFAGAGASGSYGDDSPPAPEPAPAFEASPPPPEPSPVPDTPAPSSNDW